MSGAGPFGSLPSDLEEEWDDFLFADDEALYSQLVDDATTNDNAGDDDWDSSLWYGFDTEGFPNYLPSSRDPGCWVLVFVAVYTVVLMVGLPIMVVVGRRWEARRDQRAELVKALKEGDASEGNRGGGNRDDFVENDEPGPALARMEQGGAGRAAAVPGQRKKQQQQPKQQQLKKRRPAPAADPRSQISSTTFHRPPANGTTTATNANASANASTADQSHSHSHDFGADFGHLPHSMDMTATTTNLLPTRAPSDQSGANEDGETPQSDLLFPTDFSDIYNSVNNLTSVTDDAVHTTEVDRLVQDAKEGGCDDDDTAAEDDDDDDFVDDDDPPRRSRGAAASPAKGTAAAGGAGIVQDVSTMAIGSNGLDNHNHNYNTTNNTTNASMDTVDAIHAAEEDLYNRLDVTTTDTDDGHNNLTVLGAHGQNLAQGPGQGPRGGGGGVGGRPTDDSFESALREIGANDAVLRSVMNTNSAIGGHHPNSGANAGAGRDDDDDDDDDDEEDARSVLSDAVNSVLSAGASALSGMASGMAGRSANANVSSEQMMTTTGGSSLNDTAAGELLNCTVADGTVADASHQSVNTDARDVPVPHPQAQQLPQHNIPFNRFSMQANPGGGARSTISAAPTTMTTVSRFNRRAEGFLDRLFIPSYPDDASDYAPSAIGGGGGGGGHYNGPRRANTTISAATTSRLVPDGNAIFPPVPATTAADAAARDSFARPRVVDALGRPGAGAGGRRRRGARRGFGGGIGRPEMIRRAIEQEERSEMASAMTGKYSAAHQNQNRAGAGDTNRSEIAGAARGNSRVSGPVSEMMSGVMDLSSPSSAMSAISGLRPWKRKAAASAVSGFSPSEVPSVWKNFHEDDIGPNDAADADDPGKAKMYIDEMEVETTVCCGQWALWKPKTIAYGADKVVSLAEPDNEIKRIIRLAIPFTLSTVSEAFFDAVIVAVLSRFLGTNAVTAYVLVELLLGLSDELIGGIIDAEGTICAHAFGAGNNFLAGQYVQISLLFYVIVSIPFLLMWAYVMGDTLRILGFNEDIQTIGAEYTRVVIFNYLIDGVAEAFGALLDITGHEYFGLFLDIVHNVVNLGAVLALVILVPDARLVTVGFIQLVIGAAFLVIMLSWAIFKGWYSAFWGGMLGSFAFCNFQAVKNVFLTALPLSVGSFLEYGEWELLTFFTAYLGPAEVATWALLGTVWELFEASTEGIGEAAAVRVAYHLGKGHPDMAELSSYKSMLLSFGLSLFVTAGFFLCGYDLPTWFSSDETIQRMLAELIPLVGFGNITMNFGMVAWSLVGAQGRYRLATLVSMISSWFITIPLAAIFVIGLNINLKGLVGAVIAGYSTSSVILMYIILRSDWVRLSKIVQELNAMTGEIDSSDDEDDDSSDSSSDSSSSDDDSSDDDSSSSSDDDGNDMDDSDLNVSHVSQKRLLA